MTIKNKYIKRITGFNSVLIIFLNTFIFISFTNYKCFQFIAISFVLILIFMFLEDIKNSEIFFLIKYLFWVITFIILIINFIKTYIIK